MTQEGFPSMKMLSAQFLIEFAFRFTLRKSNSAEPGEPDV